MKKRIGRIIIAILVFAFVVGIAPTGVMADIFNGVVSAAEASGSLRKVDGEWLYYNAAGDYDDAYEGLAKNDWGWWYVKDGTIDFTYTGMAKNAYGWWHVKEGKLDTTFEGFDVNDYGVWKMKNGKVDSNFTGMTKDEFGWCYVKKGKLIDDYTGLAKNKWGWWYFMNGRINYIYVGLAKNDYGWWYIKKGTIDFSYNGVAQNDYGWWKVKKGKVVSKGTAPKNSSDKEGGTAGFLYDEEKSIFYSAKEPWQRKWGYNGFYDWAAQLIVLYYDTVRIKFNYNGFDWLVQLWKGQYGFVLLGAEVGIYYKEEGSLVEHYKCDDNSKRLKAGFVCYDNNNFLFNREYQDSWWLTGFVEGKLKRFNDRSEMALQILITLKDEAMRDAFVVGLENAGFVEGKATVANPDTYFKSGDKDIVIFWQYLNEMVDEVQKQS